jgi:hypothetical protein
MSSVIAGCAHRRTGRRRRRSLLSEKFWCAGYDCCHRRNPAKEAAPSIDLHYVLLESFGLVACALRLGWCHEQNGQSNKFRIKGKHEFILKPARSDVVGQMAYNVK